MLRCQQATTCLLDLFRSAACFSAQFTAEHCAALQGCSGQRLVCGYANCKLHLWAVAAVHQTLTPHAVAVTGGNDCHQWPCCHFCRWRQLSKAVVLPRAVKDTTTDILAQVYPDTFVFSPVEPCKLEEIQSVVVAGLRSGTKQSCSFQKHSAGS